MPIGFKHFSLANFTADLKQGLENNRHILLCAPTGSGKSLFFPYFLFSQFSGKIIILEPRRLAAQELARYFAKCLGEPCGKTVGYKFRMNQCCSEETKILFQTYGNHLEEILHQEANVDWVLFDEFHERKADMDLLFAYYLKKAETNPLRLGVMSAKLKAKPIEQALKTSILETGVPLYPVQILHQNSTTKNFQEQEICQALRTLQRNNIWKTTLVFLPGKSEIKRAHEAVEIAFGKNGPELLDLYGGQSEKEQERLFSETQKPRIVFTTNIAETSLTIPNVSGVIDSGYERTLEYSENTGISHLRLSRISLQNAVQRTGRAGRLQEGLCIRLWKEEEEKNFEEGIVPEILKGNLGEILLKQRALKEKLSSKEMPFLTPPPEEKTKKALQELESMGFLNQGKLTELGIEALETPIKTLKIQEFFLKVRTSTPLFLAMISYLEGGNEFFQKEKKSYNLKELAEGFLDSPHLAPKEVKYIFDKLSYFVKRKQFKEKDIDFILEKLLVLYPERLAIRWGEAFKLPDKQMLRLKAEESNALLAFNLLRTGNGNLFELHSPAYLDIPQKFLYSKEDSIRYELQWQSSKGRFIGIEIRENNGIEIARENIIPQEAQEEVRQKLEALTSQYWKAKQEKEKALNLWEDEKNQVLFSKMKLAAKYFPEYQLPLWNEEDMELILEEFFDGIFLERDLTSERYRSILEEYFGHSMIPWLHKNFPDTLTLPNGKKARYIYTESLVEISARLGDFLESRGKHFIAEGRIPVRYDILAPNYRSVQKTWDLDGFWKSTYLEIRKELRGRYPKHPWPEKILVD